MKLIDTHSHLFLEEFTSDLPEVIERAKAAGIYKICMPNIDMSSITPMLEVSRQFKGYCYPMIGLHPTSVKEDYEKELCYMESLLEQPHEFIAIGEVGMDLYWDTTYKEDQIKAFDRQIQWALKYELPLVIHSRNSFEEIVAVMEPYKGTSLTGIFHSFGGTVEEAHKLLEHTGFVLGINGVVTFKNSSLASVLKEVPVERVVLETDSPYLTPVPYRGKRNETAYLAYVLGKIAEVYEISSEKAAAITTKNALKIFKISES